MRADRIAPRTARWEIDQPQYRIHFWQRSSDRPDVGWASEKWRVSDADIREVFAWADGHADGRRITSWVEILLDGEPGLVRLTGWEADSSGRATPMGSLLTAGFREPAQLPLRRAPR